MKGKREKRGRQTEKREGKSRGAEGKRGVGEWTKRQRGKGKDDSLSIGGIDAPDSCG